MTDLNARIESNSGGQVKLYKVTAEDGSSMHGGTGKWCKGRWRGVRGKLIACERGLHLCREQDPHPLAWPPLSGRLRQPPTPPSSSNRTRSSSAARVSSAGSIHGTSARSVSSLPTVPNGCSPSSRSNTQTTRDPERLSPWRDGSPNGDVTRKEMAAARDAAGDAAMAAGDAARNAARAARDAAGDAAMAAARDAAWDAARAAQTEDLMAYPARRAVSIADRLTDDSGSIRRVGTPRKRTRKPAGDPALLGPSAPSHETRGPDQQGARRPGWATPHSAISAWKTAKSLPSPEMLAQLVEIFDAPHLLEMVRAAKTADVPLLREALPGAHPVQRVEFLREGLS